MQRALAVVGLVAFSPAAVAAPPAVTISYSPSLDTACSILRGYEIKNQWKEELAGKVEEYRDGWAKIGPKLLGTTERMTGRKFAAGNISAHLTLCDLPSQAIFGVSVNMRYALASFTKNPVPMRYKIGVLYHEILHRFVEDNLSARSVLLAQHRDEQPRVREHLHLLALQKAVYLDLGMKDELAEIIDIDSQLPDGSYRRAWQIVNQGADDYLKYVEELKTHEP